MQMLNRNNGQKQQTQNNPFQMISQFQQFARGMSPQQAQNILYQKLQSGEMSQQQFDNLKQQAQQFSKMFGLK